MPYQLVRKVILSVDILDHDLQLQVLEAVSKTTRTTKDRLPLFSKETKKGDQGANQSHACPFAGIIQIKL